VVAVIHYRNPDLCRVPFVGHSAKTSLPRAALGKVLHSITMSFTECRTLGTEIHSVKTSLPSGKHSAKVALAKGPSAAVLKLTAVSLCRGSTLGKVVSLPSVKYLALGKELFTECLVWTLGKAYFYFLNFFHQTFLVCSYTM
jgi:hypothetical protein